MLRREAQDIQQRAFSIRKRVHKQPLAGGRYLGQGRYHSSVEPIGFIHYYLLIHLHGGQGLPPVSLRNGLSNLRIPLPIIYCASGTFRPLVHFHLASTGPGSRL